MISIDNLIEIYKIARQSFSLPLIVVIMSIIGTTVVIKKRKKIIGFAITTGEHLHYIAVTSRYIGKGYGRKLFSKIYSSVRTLYVNVKNKRAIKFYKMNGFRIKEDNEWITGKRYLMSK